MRVSLPKGRAPIQVPLLVLHIFGGSVSLLSGTVAMAVRKGSRIHRSAGSIFTLAMLLLASSGFCIAFLKNQPGNMIGATATVYLVATAWLAGRRKEIGYWDWAALLFGLAGIVAIAATTLPFFQHSEIASRKAPTSISVFFGLVLVLATSGDIRMLLRTSLSKRQLLIRHLWRMCFALFIATGSFFLGQQQVFPASLRGSVVLTVLAVVPFPLLLYWFIRVRFGRTPAVV